MNGTWLVGLILFLLIVLVIGPVFTIWSLNTLFLLEIPVTFKTWMAAAWLAAVLSCKVNKKD